MTRPLVTLLLLLACLPGCGENGRDAAPASRPEAVREAARSLIEAGDYTAARTLLREAVRAHPDDEPLARELATIEQLVRSPSGAGPGHSLIGQIRAQVAAAEKARADGDEGAAREAAEAAVMLVDTAPREIGDKDLVRQIEALRTWLVR